MRNHVRSFKTYIRDEIIKKGGWVNSHAHADRAFTMTPEKSVFTTAAICNKNGIWWMR